MARKKSGGAKPAPPPEPVVAKSDPTGRATIAAVAVLVAILAIGGWWWARSGRFTIGVNPDRNVLLVTIDTLRADALGSYGGGASTPNLDRLASHGAQFGVAHAHAVVTLATHAIILTGRYPYEHGIRDNPGYRLDPSHPTAAPPLNARGLTPGAFIGGFPLDRRFGLNAGFDLYDDRLNAATAPIERSRAAGQCRRRRALRWIRAQPGKWFAWVHAYDPHAPPAARRMGDEVRVRSHLGEVSWTDSALGPLFERLSSQPRPTTLVVVTGDHGESQGER